MADVDLASFHQVERFITDANVHYVRTWILCYETCAPGSDRQSRYEQLLRGNHSAGHVRLRRVIAQMLAAYQLSDDPGARRNAHLQHDKA